MVLITDVPPFINISIRLYFIAQPLENIVQLKEGALSPYQKNYILL